jgi:tetratricopeptide (TPR) repeat protein
MPVEKIQELTSPDVSSRYYAAARTAFRQGDYRNAIRLASHAAIESSHKAQIHELLSLALFASGEYDDASSAAHAVLAKGAVSDWNLLFGYYGDVDRYTEQLRALERYTIEHPESAAERFLLGYHYLMIGEPEKARDEFAQTVRLNPSDKLAQRYLNQLQPNLEQVQPEVLPPFPPPAPAEPQGVVL